MVLVRRSILLLSSLLVLFALSACGGGSNAGSNGGGANISSDPREAVLNAARAQLENMPFRSTMTSEDAGASSTVVIEFESPESMHMILGEMEIILVDGKAFLKEGDAWTEDAAMAGMASNITAQMSPDRVEEMMANVTDIKLAGEETIDGEVARIYEYAGDLLSVGSDGTTQTRTWIRESDGLPVKSVVESNMGGATSVTEMTIEYDDTIDVEAPAVSQ
jgi:hypothetical protein